MTHIAFTIDWQQVLRIMGGWSLMGPIMVYLLAKIVDSFGGINYTINPRMGHSLDILYLILVGPPGWVVLILCLFEEKR